MNSISVGIDVSLETLVTSSGEAKPFFSANDKAGIHELARQLPAGCQVHLEASGGYERLLRRTLQELGHEVHVHNPLKTKRMAQARGVRAKTDPIDAVQLSRSGPLIPANKQKSVEREQLCDFSRMIDSMKRTLSDYKKRTKIPELDNMALAECSRLCRNLHVQIKRMEIEFVKRVQSSSLREQYEFALSVPSIGAHTARVLVCELPEDYEEACHAQIASYVGLAPIDNASGKLVRKSRIARGNSRLKAALYMAALSAVARQDWTKGLYARLKAKGRCHQTAIVAVMRRILIRAHAVLKRGTPWQDEPIGT